MSLKYSYNLEPRDLLFLRDARPMAASDAGMGGNLPRPDQLWNALINAFHREWQEQQEWEGSKHQRKESDKNQESSFRFGALKTVGPFLCRDGELYFPAPLDLEMQLVKSCGTDLPKPLEYAFMVKKLGKREEPQWISAVQYQRYLEGKLCFGDLEGGESLYDIERNIGIAIDSESGTAVGGRLYQAEYLRLKTGVSLVFAAECELKPRGGGVLVDVFERFGSGRKIVIGGQQGVATISQVRQTFTLPQVEIKGALLRWTLIAPAIFNSGWRPDWVAEDGSVMLRNIKREPGMSRREWKQIQSEAPFVGGQLVAARVGKPFAFSGWDLQTTAPKPTRLAVPAGSSYVFNCGTVEKARELATLLHGRPRSTEDGAKGFGYGLCSSIECGAQDPGLRTQGGELEQCI